MATVLRWRFQDPADPTPSGTYVFPRNPKGQTSPFPKKAITSKASTAIDGQVLMWEGPTPPTPWSFSGTIKDAAHYEALRSWVYDRGGRIFVWDHFGRRLLVVLDEFKPVPSETPKLGRYWYHTYDISGTVLAISNPTIGDGGPA